MYSTPKVLFLKQTVSTSGSCHWFIELGKYISDKVGMCVMYADFPVEKQAGNLVLKKGVAYRKSNYFQRLWSWLRYFCGAVRIVWSYPSSCYLLIVAQPPYLPVIGWVRAVFYKQRYLVWIDDVYPDVLVRTGFMGNKNPTILLWQLLNRLIYKKADYVTTLGPAMADLVRQYVSKDRRDSVAVIPTWVDSNRLRPLKKSQNEFAIAHGQVNKLTILYSGNIGITHDLDSLISVARHLKDHDNIHFVIIGTGPGWEQARRLSDNLANVTVLPFQPMNVLPYSLASGDVSVISLGKGYAGLSMPSRTYFSMAVGSAILGISDKGSDIEYVVEKYNCGVNVTPGDIDGLARAILRFSGDKKFLNSCKKNARITSEKVFSLDFNAERVLELMNPQH